MKYRGSFRMELLRKAVHAAAGIGIVLLFQAGFLDLGLLGLLILLLAAVVVYNWRAEKELLTRILAINRVDARLPGLDILAFFVGCFIVLLVFPREIAFAAILILSFGDSVAHLVSRRFGGIETFLTRTTYLEGTIAGICAAALAAWLYVPLIPALVAAAAAMFIEAGELRIGDHYIDDNLLIPIVAGATLYVVNLAFPFGIFPF